jgi:hypothetical protein
VALVAPAGTTTLMPSRFWSSASESWVTNTVAPPAGAGALKVTVPVAVVSPATLVGFTVTEASTGPAFGGLTFNWMGCEVPPNDAVIVVAIVADTELVVTGKKTATASAGMVTVAGTTTEGESESSVTTAPPAGAAALRTTLPVAEPPPMMFCVVRETKLRVGAGVGVTWRVVLCVVPSVAEMVAVVAAVTAVVVTGNVTLEEPAGTVTLAGTVTALELSERATTSPPAGAVAFSCTSPVAAVPPATLEPNNVTEETDGFVPAGRTVKSADRLTPAPVAVIVTTVAVVTALVEITNPPLVVAGTEATAGLLLVNWNVWSYEEKAAMFTDPVTVPELDPIQELGVMVTESGARGGTTVTVVFWLTPL